MWLVAIPVIVLAALGGVFGYRWIHNRPPYGPSAIHAVATIQLTDGSHVLADVTRLGATGIQPWYGTDGDQLFVGQVNYRIPSNAQGAGRYAIVVIDKAGNQVSPLIWGAGANSGQVIQGWESTLSDAAKRWDWLAPMGARPNPTVVFAPTDTVGPITFQGAFHQDAGTITQSDLMVALVFMGTEGQIYWAERLIN